MTPSPLCAGHWCEAEVWDQAWFQTVGQRTSNVQSSALWKVKDVNSVVQIRLLSV